LQLSVFPLCPFKQYPGRCSKERAQLTTFDALEFPNSPIVLLFGAEETEMLKSSLKKTQTDKQTNKHSLDAVYLHEIIHYIALTHKKYLSFIFVSFVRKFLLSLSEL